LRSYINLSFHWSAHSSFETFTAVKIEVEVFRVVKPCSDVGYQRFRGPCCLH